MIYVGHRNGRREPRACMRCGFVRKVKVTDRVEIDNLTDVAIRKVGEMFTKRCRACELEVTAEHYASLARLNRERAFAERAKQAKRGMQ